MLICDVIVSRSENWNTLSRGIDPVFAQDAEIDSFYNRNMASTPQHDWFIHAWLATTRKSQADLRRLTGWSKRKASDVLNGGRYNRDIINDVATALHVEPFELLLHPDDAMEIRQVRATLRLVADRKVAYKAAADADFHEGDGTDG